MFVFLLKKNCSKFCITQTSTLLNAYALKRERVAFTIKISSQKRLGIPLVPLFSSSWFSQVTASTAREMFCKLSVRVKPSALGCESTSRPEPALFLFFPKYTFKMQERRKLHQIAKFLLCGALQLDCFCQKTKTYLSVLHLNQYSKIRRV